MAARSPHSSHHLLHSRNARLPLPLKTRQMVFLTEEDADGARAKHNSLSARQTAANASGLKRTSTNLFAQINYRCAQKPDLPQHLDFRTSLYPPTSRANKWVGENPNLKYIRIGNPERTQSTLPRDLRGQKIVKSKSGYAIRFTFTPKALAPADACEAFSAHAADLGASSMEVTMQAKNGWKLREAIDAIDRSSAAGLPENRRFDLTGLKAHLRKQLRLSEKSRGGMMALSLSALKRSDPAGFKAQRESEARSGLAREGSEGLGRLVVLPKREEPEDPDDSPEDRLRQAQLREKYQGSPDAHSSVVLKLHQVRLTDAAFLRSTKPNKDYYDSVRKLHRKRVTEAAGHIVIEESGGEQVARMATKSYANIEELPDSAYLIPMSKMVTSWVREAPRPGARQTRKQVDMAVSNLFTMVHQKVSRPESKSSELDTAGFLETFFETCDALILKEIEAESLAEGATASGRLGEVCQALNTLVCSTRSGFHLVGPLYLTNMVKGYLQNLFLVFFDLTEAEAATWTTRLRNVGIRQLSIADNLDALFTVHSYLNYFVVDESFFPFFDRFYTCVLGLLIKAERLAGVDATVWMFVFDLFALHFIFMKTVIGNLYCRNVMSRLAEVVLPENILLRFLSTLESVPEGLLLRPEVLGALQGALLQMAKMFENGALYERRLQTLMSEQVLSSVFEKANLLLADRFSKNSKEQLPILSVVRGLCRSVSAFATASFDLPPYSHSRKAATDHLNLLMMSLQRKKAAGRLQDALHETYRHILEASSRKK